MAAVVCQTKVSAIAAAKFDRQARVMYPATTMLIIILLMALGEHRVGVNAIMGIMQALILPTTYDDVRQRTSDVHRRTSSYVDVRRRTSTYFDVRRRMSTYVDVRRRTSSCVDVKKTWSSRSPEKLEHIFVVVCERRDWNGNVYRKPFRKLENRSVAKAKKLGPSPPDKS